MGTRKIGITHGKIALVDDMDYEHINQYKWHTNPLPHTELLYADRSILLAERINGKKRKISMHREILGITNPKIFVDHINRNGLDNRRSSLAKAITQQYE